MDLWVFIAGGVLLVVGYLLFSYPTWEERRQEYERRRLGQISRVERQGHSEMQGVVKGAVDRIEREERSRRWEQS